jgi:hypothetical protein
VIPDADAAAPRLTKGTRNTGAVQPSGQVLRVGTILEMDHDPSLCYPVARMNFLSIVFLPVRGKGSASGFDGQRWARGVAPGAPIPYAVSAKQRTEYSMPIPNDATIADVMSRPNAPATEYVRKIVEHMWDCRRQFSDPSVRIGVTGEGRAPNYRIEYTQNTDGRHSIFAVYNGLSHRPVEDLGEAVGFDLDAQLQDR